MFSTSAIKIQYLFLNKALYYWFSLATDLAVSVDDFCFFSQLLCFAFFACFLKSVSSGVCFPLVSDLFVCVAHLYSVTLLHDLCLKALLLKLCLPGSQ